jgi:hypothetical protein
MFLFSWKKIYKISGGQVNSIYLIFKMLVNSEIPKNKYDPIYKYYSKDYSGQCFLQNPSDLLENAFRYTRKEVVEYIALASYRSYSDYLMFGITTISVMNSPLPLNKLKQNRLLRIENDTVHFLYEKSN